MARVPKNALREIHIDIDSHNEERTRNPARRKGTSKPRRASQVTKRAPTKRLVKRREKNTKPGYFPNPVRHSPNPYISISKAIDRVVRERGELKKQAAVSYAQGLIDMALQLRKIEVHEANLYLEELKLAMEKR